MSTLVPFPAQVVSLRYARSGFEAIPKDLSRAELLRYFTYSEQDRQQIFQCRGEHNQIGFALLLSGVRLTGRFPHDFDMLPRRFLQHLCQQLNLDAPLFLDYPHREPTRREHIARLREYLGLRSFAHEDQGLIIRHVTERVRGGERQYELLASAERMLRSQHIILPGVTTLERLIRAARTKAEDDLYQEIVMRIDEGTRAKMLALLEPVEGQMLSPFQQLQQAAGLPSPEALGAELDALEQVRGILPEKVDLRDLNSHLVERLADLVSGSPTQTMLRYVEPKRSALLLCWLWRLRTQLIDTALTISNDLVAGILRRARNGAEREAQQQRKRVGPVLQLCREVVLLLLDRAIPDAQVRAEIRQRYSEEQLQSLSEECEALGQPVDRLYVDELRQRYGYARRFAPRLLESFVLRTTGADEPMLKAVEYLRDCNNEIQKFDQAEAPIDFVPRRWLPVVCPEPGKVDRALWEICLLDQLRQGLKSGQVQVPHSRSFQPVESYLLEREEWERGKIMISQEHNLPLSFETYWPKLETLLQENLRALDEDAPQNPKLEIRDDQFHVARLEKLATPKSARELKRRIQRMLRSRHLPDLLQEVQGWTNFLSAFTRASTGRPITGEDIAEQLKLLTCLIAEGCNIGLTQMALHGPGITYDQLEETHFNYIREETLQLAAAALVNFHLSQWLPAAWGQGFTSSSDARMYGVPVRALNATYHPHYFASAGRGIGVYTHVSDLWIPFYTQVITCHVRQAPYILDGLLYHGTRLEPKEHYTDTHGFTDAIFGTSFLLGIRFCPRIKDLPEQRLWRLPGEAYRNIENVFSGKINVELIGESWDEIIRLIASIKCGEVRASLIVSKVGAAGHRNKLYRGLQELGRLVKTAYIAEYLCVEELRRRVLLGLNKGESMHKLAGRVRFGQQGEFRDRTYEDQLNSASSMNLLLAAIVVWNTVHLQGCLKRLRADGYEYSEDDLRFLSPLMHRHLGIYGRYQFSPDILEGLPSPEEFTY